MKFTDKLYKKTTKGLNLTDTEDEEPKSFLWLIIFLIIIFFAWSSNSKIDQVTRAQGVVIPSSRIQVIQSADGGVIQDINVKEGDVVEKGQVLAKLDSAKIKASYLETKSKTAALEASEARIKAEIYGGNPSFPEDLKAYPEFIQNQVALLKKRRLAINQEISSLKTLKDLAVKELNMSAPLLKTGDVSMTDVLKLQRQVADLESQISNRKNKYLQDLQGELAKTEEDLSSTQEFLAQKQDQLTHIELRSPTDGIVKNIRVTTLGGVIKAGEDVMQIVPLEDNLIIEAKIKPSEVGFLQIGMPTAVKIDAYDYTIYGTLKGKLVYLSPDTLSEDLKQGEQAYYRIRVETQRRQFSAKPNEKLHIQPGMTSTVEIKTGTNTVLKYLLKPVIKTFNESLKEK